MSHRMAGGSLKYEGTSPIFRKYIERLLDIEAKAAVATEKFAQRVA